MVSIQKFQITVLVSNRIESNTEVTIRLDSKFRIFTQHLIKRCTLALPSLEWYPSSALEVISAPSVAALPHGQPTMKPGFSRKMTSGFYLPSQPMSLALPVSLHTYDARTYNINQQLYISFSVIYASLEL